MVRIRCTISIHDWSTEWAMDRVCSATSARPHTRGAPHQSLAATCRMSQQPRVKPVVKHASFVENPLYFLRINPRYSTVPKYFYSVLFSSNLDPVLSRFSARSPIIVEIHIFNCFNSKVGSVYLQKCHYILFHV